MPRPVSKIIKFPVGPNYVTIEIAFAAAVTHSEALLAAGNTWSVDNARVQYQQEAAGVLIGIFEPKLLDGQPYPDPIGTERIAYVGDYWVGPPP